MMPIASGAHTNASAYFTTLLAALASYKSCLCANSMCLESRPSNRASCGVSVHGAQLMSGRTHLQTLKHQPRTEAVQSAGGSHPLSAQSASVALHLRGGAYISLC